MDLGIKLQIKNTHDFHSLYILLIQLLSKTKIKKLPPKQIYQELIDLSLLQFSNKKLNLVNMTLKQDESYECESDTESVLSSQFDQLNHARIQDTPISKFLTPSKRKRLTKKKQIDDSSDDQDWKSQMTRTIYNGTPKQVSSERQNQLTKKYPKQVQNKKFGTVTVNIKNKESSKYQNICSICLDKYSNIRGLLKCGHKFCLQCIQQWTKTSTNCPCCRAQFKQYVKITINQEKIEQKRQVFNVQQRKMEFNQLDYFVCYTCNLGDDEDVLLICDMCDFYSCHVYCDHTLRNIFPTGDWYCKHCRETLQISQKENGIGMNLLITQTQTSVNSQRPNTQYTRTLTLFQPSQNLSGDEESQESLQNAINFTSVRKKSPVGRAQLSPQSRSKAYEIMNFHPRNPRNRLPDVINRITNNTSMNLRNLRRRRFN